MEKIAENRTIMQYLPYITRWDYLATMFTEDATGMRMMHNYFHIGGVVADLPYVWIDKCLDFCVLSGVVNIKILLHEILFFRTS
ncbi:NAD(P)H-quinone oxidoreductase subunit h chloroplastic [Phtheirospermum japonicum]|uniref:NAD(P)H-quinone oxidoreductase subunit h chloroplastic n=1 Tax=Phtheirospermum japonicum TaxID=374723 RepID=A0A830CR99_9LAMI|nr:NAD(P)H-quinone oxidoreductase subunit h chloroplastic [Phtheirospermum japonicum]